MRRLSAARDREFRHVVHGNVAWRFTWASVPYAWCRACNRDATKQVTWLIDNGYLPGVGGLYTVNVLADTDIAAQYMRRYP